MSNDFILKLNTENGDQLDLTSVQLAEGRIHEVAFVTPHKAHELMACFNQAHFDIARAIMQARLLHHKATRAANQRRAIVILEECPKRLQEKGLTNSRSPNGSEDMREAILATDNEYQNALEKANELKVLIEWLREKQESIAMAWRGTREVFGESGFLAKNPNLGGGGPQSPEAFTPIADEPVYRFPSNYQPPVRKVKYEP